LRGGTVLLAGGARPAGGGRAPGGRVSVALHHLLSDFAAGDALGTITTRFRDISRELGFRSEIFSNVIDPRIADQARPAGQLEAALRPGDAVMYHLSIGSPVAGLFARLPARKLIYYQN